MSALTISQPPAKIKKVTMDLMTYDPDSSKGQALEPPAGFQ